MLKKITLICSCILIMLFSTELVLRLYGWREYPKLYEEISDPDIRWLHRAGFKGWLWSTDIKINSQGLRDREYSFDKPEDTFRIFAVGECTTFGQSVALEVSFTKQLEAILNDRKPFRNIKHYEVINGGLSQWDDLQKVYFLKKYGLKYHPDLIIFSHDLSRKPWIEPRARLRWFRLMAKSIPKQIYSLRYLLINIEHAIEHAWNNYRIYNNKQFVEYRYAESGLSRKKICQALKELASLSQERHIPVFVVFFPWLEDLAEDKYAFKWIHDFYGEECRKNNLPFLDLYEAYFKNKTVESVRVSSADPRPNSLGHRVIAEMCYKELISRRPLIQD
jgi:hypothetical protein